MKQLIKSISVGNELLDNIEGFIRKYYLNQLLKGALITAGSMTLTFLVFTFSEYFGYLSREYRGILLFTYIILTGFLIIKLIIIPLLNYAKIGRRLKEEEAAVIIGKHFNDIEDRLLNTLQLIKAGLNPGEDKELLMASIAQRTNTLRLFKFDRIIDLRKTLSSFIYLLLPVVLILIFVIISPGTVTEPANRILHFNKEFEKPAPYTIILLTRNLVALQQQDFELKVKLEGKIVPADLFITVDGIKFKMNREKGFIYSYLFRTVQGNKRFSFSASGFSSQEYELKVFPRPVILNFSQKLDFPAYIKRPAEIRLNEGDVTVPEGTTISWEFTTKDVTDVGFKLENNLINLKPSVENRFLYSVEVMEDFSYSLFPRNLHTFKSDSLNFQVKMIPDGFPTIAVVESKDSNIINSGFINGTVKDDYGFTKLIFKYFLLGSSRNDTLERGSRELPLIEELNNQNFIYTISLDSIKNDMAEEYMYYFEIWDNDGIHGPKSAKTEIRGLRILTKDQMLEEVEKNEEEISDLLDRGIKESKKLTRDLENMQKALIEKNSADWQDRKKLEDFLKKAENIEKKLEEVKTKNRQNQDLGEKSLNTDERILEKQQKIDDLMNQIMTQELKEQLAELREMLKKVDKEKMAELLEKMKISTKQLEEEMDRNLALLERLAFERKLELVLEELKANALEMQKLSEKSEVTELKEKNLIRRQEEMKAKSDSLNKTLQNLENDGKSLENAVDLGNNEKSRDSIARLMESASSDLKAGSNKKASKSQKEAGNKMNELAEDLKNAMAEDEEEQLGEDARAIRLLLEGILRLSFEQEELISLTKMVTRSDPKYIENLKRQKEVVDKIEVIEDSLISIGKRQVSVQPVINKEISLIKSNIKIVLDAMDTRNINLATARQQYIMTSLNNLAVMLNESLEKMNNEMSQSMSSKSGNKSCSKPGSKGGKKKSKGLTDMQKSFGQQLQKLKEGLEGKNKAGKEAGSKSGSMNKEIAKLAAQQEAIRSELQQLRDGSDGISKEEREALNQAFKEMEEMEKELVNKRINQQLFERQQKILSRLLESEKAEMMREKEDTRKSVETKNQKFSNPIDKIKYKELIGSGVDDIQYTLPAFNSFYRNKINGYNVKIEKVYE